MSKRFFTDIKKIRSAIDLKKLVVFAGAGISIDAGIPDWNTLIDEILSEIDISEDEKDALKIAQMYFNERQQKEYIENIRTILKHKKVKNNEIHEALFNLGPEHIITTNYDDLLEQVIKKNSLPFSIVTRDIDFPYTLNTNLLVKMHGDLDHTDIVFKEDDYLNYSQNHPLIEAFIKSIFSTKVVLFVGYSFSDVNFKIIIQSVRNILGHNFQNAYLLTIDEKIHPSQREYYKNKGINVLNYNDAKIENGENFISSFLHGENPFKKDLFIKGENLSEKGQCLLNFLRFIATYKFNATLQSLSILDQLYFSLNRFNELKSLPPDFVADLYPINISKKYTFKHSTLSILTNNRKLFDFFNSHVYYEGNEIKFRIPEEVNTSNKNRKKFEAKLRYIIDIFNYSLIFYLFKETDEPDSLGNFGWSKEYIKLIIHRDTCNCSNCKYSRFQFNEVIIESLNSSIDETSSIQNDLRSAFINYRVGNFSLSFKQFGETANKAWQMGKYFTYYIAKHNMKSLRNLIHFDDDNLTEENRKIVLRKIEDIDFDKLLFQIPFKDEEEFELLKMIRDDSVLTSAESVIDENLERIREIYEWYESKTKWTSGPDYTAFIRTEVLKIVSFYTNNYIISDEFKEFKTVCNKAIEAWLIGFSISKAYKERMESFDKLFFEIAVLYGNTKRLEKIIEKYLVNKKMVFDSKSLKESIELINNFLKSFYFEITFLGTSTHPQKNISNQLSVGLFEEKCRRMFDNIFLLISKVELPPELFNELITNLISFIKNENFLYEANIRHLSNFIHQNNHLFSKEDFENIVKAVDIKIDTYRNGNLIKIIGNAFEKNKLEGITDEDVLERLLSFRKHKNEKHNSLIPLWQLSGNLFKKKIKQMIMETLKNNFDIELYAAASNKGIIDYNSYLDKFIESIDKIKDRKIHSMVDHEPELLNYSFIKAMHFIYKMGVSFQDKRLKGFTNPADYMKFYLNPEKFNYKNFNVEWLKVGDEEVFFERFKKIEDIKIVLEKSLKEKFDGELSEIYIKYFL